MSRKIWFCFCVFKMKSDCDSFSLKSWEHCLKGPMGCTREDLLFSYNFIFGVSVSTRVNKQIYKRTFEELVENPILLLITEFKNHKGISIAMPHSQSTIARKSLETCVYLNPLSDLAICSKLFYKAFFDSFATLFLQDSSLQNVPTFSIGVTVP